MKRQLLRSFLLLALAGCAAPAELVHLYDGEPRSLDQVARVWGWGAGIEAIDGNQPVGEDGKWLRGTYAVLPGRHSIRVVTSYIRTEKIEKSNAQNAGEIVGAVATWTLAAILLPNRGHTSSGGSPNYRTTERTLSHHVSLNMLAGHRYTVAPLEDEPEPPGGVKADPKLLSRFYGCHKRVASLSPRSGERVAVAWIGIFGERQILFQGDPATLYVVDETGLEQVLREASR